MSSSKAIEYVIQIDSSIGDKIIKWSDHRIYESSRKDEAFDYLKKLIASRGDNGNANNIRIISRKTDVDETIIFGTSDEDKTSHEALDKLAELSQKMDIY